MLYRSISVQELDPFESVLIRGLWAQLVLVPSWQRVFAVRRNACGLQQTACKYPVRLLLERASCQTLLKHVFDCLVPSTLIRVDYQLVEADLEVLKLLRDFGFDEKSKLAQGLS